MGGPDHRRGGERRTPFYPTRTKGGSTPAKRGRHKARQTIAIRDGGMTCWWCGRPLTHRSATIDHVLPLSRGGTNHIDNKVLACGPCNEAKGDNHPLVWIARIFACDNWPEVVPPSLAAEEES